MTPTGDKRPKVISFSAMLGKRKPMQREFPLPPPPPPKLGSSIPIPFLFAGWLILGLIVGAAIGFLIRGAP